MSTAASKFDAGPLLLDAIGQFTFEETTQEDDLASHVTNLAELGRLSSTMRWWHKSKPDQMSPLISLIQVHIRHGFLTMDDTIRHVIHEVVHRAGICPSGAHGAAEALVYSFCVPRGRRMGKVSHYPYTCIPFRRELHDADKQAACQVPRSA